MVVLKPGSRTQAQHIDNLSVTTLYMPNSAGVLTALTATADSLNAIGERLKVANKTGGPLAAGTLVYISGYDATLAAPEVTEADADYPEKAAQFVLPAAIANGATGYAEASYTITGLNTSGASAVDDPVYLSATAGGWTLSAPTGDRIVQKVGVVKVKHASTGEIYFFPGESVPEKIGTSGLQTDSVDKTIIAADVAGDGLKQNADGSLEVDPGDGLDVTGDEVVVDVTDFIDTSYGLTENANDIRVNLKADAGVSFDAGAIQVVAGDGVDVGATGVAVDVTDIIDTAAGLKEDASNNIQVALKTDSGLALDGGEIKAVAGTQIDIGASGISVKDTGQMAVGTILFAATGDCTSVTIGSTVYTYDATPVVADGEWDYGASASESATNLAAAINGKTDSPYAATANTDTVHVYAKTVGTAGNVSIVRTGGAQPATVEALTGGVDAATKQFTIVKRVISANDVDTAVLVNIPVPFAPTKFTATVTTTAGAPKAITDAITIGTSPNRIVITGAGDTHLIAGDIVTLFVME